MSRKAEGTWVRLELGELEALRAAAAADKRTLSAWVRKTVVDRLEADGYLPAAGPKAEGGR